MILKSYANLSVGQTHYRRAGQGKPLLLLHASPMSSELMVPTMQKLFDMADVVAPDTPGYGNSDPLPEAMLNAASDLSPYVDWLREYIEVMGFDKVGLYGTATGAQISIEFARTHPDKLDYVILDNAAHFTDEERTDIIEKYFPDVSAQDDGSHLKQVWDMAAGVFTWFPWYAQDEEHRISEKDPPVGAVHAMALAYLAAGQDYAQAYRRAFLNEDASRATQIQVPVRVIRWAGGMLKPYSDRYDNFDWPEHIKMCYCDESLDQRFAAIKDAVSEFS